jgi:hypothetical protein
MSLGLLLVIALIVLVAIKILQRGSNHERHGAGRAMAMGCGLVVFFGGISAFLLLAVVLTRTTNWTRRPFPPAPVAVPVYTFQANASVLEIHLLAPSCLHHDVKPTELATVILALTNEILFDNHEIVTSAQARTSNEQLKTWEHAVVRADRKQIELKQIAQLSRRHPNGGWRLPIDTIVIMVDSPHAGMKATDFTHRLVEEASLLLSAVSISRLTSAERQTFQMDRENDALLLRLPNPDGGAVHPLEGRPTNQLGNSLSAIEIELATRGWSEASPMQTAELPADSDGEKHSFGEWMVATCLAEFALEGVWGSDAAQSSWPTVARASRHPIQQVSRVDQVPEQTAVAESPAAERLAVVPQASDTTKVEVEVAPDRRPELPAPGPYFQASQDNALHPVSSTAPATPIGGARPAWVDLPPEQRVGSDGVLRLVGTTMALEATPQDSYTAADGVVHELFDQYVRRVYGSSAVAKIRLPHEITVGNVVSWTEPKESTATGMTMYETHVMLTLDPHARHVIEERLQSLEIRRRVRLAGAGAGVLLGLIATLWGYLKLDTASRGYYSGRLKLAAGAAAVATVSGAWAVVRGVL